MSEKLSAGSTADEQWPWSSDFSPLISNFLLFKMG